MRRVLDEVAPGLVTESWQPVSRGKHGLTAVSTEGR